MQSRFITILDVNRFYVWFFVTKSTMGRMECFVQFTFKWIYGWNLAENINLLAAGAVDILTRRVHSIGSNVVNSIRFALFVGSNFFDSTNGWSNVEYSTSEARFFGCRIFDTRRRPILDQKSNPIFLHAFSVDHSRGTKYLIF